jgi:hypothetical protein
MFANDGSLLVANILNQISLNPHYKVIFEVVLDGHHITVSTWDYTVLTSSRTNFTLKTFLYTTGPTIKSVYCRYEFESRQFRIWLNAQMTIRRF